MNQFQVLAITGGAAGVGNQIAREFLQQQQNNVIAIIDIYFKDGLQKEMNSLYGEDRILFLQCDVTNEQKQKEIFQSIFKKYGRLDIFVNNAGFGLNSGEVENTLIKNDSNELENYNYLTNKIVQTNLVAVIKLSVLAVYYMRINKIKGHIINITSMSSITPQGVCPVFSSTKHAVNGFTRSLYHIKDKFGIRVNTLCPSLVETPIVLNVLGNKSGKEYQNGCLVKLGIALSTTHVSQVFMQINNDQNAHGELVYITVDMEGDGNPKVVRDKFVDPPKIPGENQIGGSLSRIPSLEEVIEYRQKLKNQRSKL